MIRYEELHPLFNSCNNNSEKVFISRAKELINPLTRPSYRVKLLNGRLCLRELKEVAEDIVDHGISFQNFQDVWEEFNDFINSDPCLVEALPYHKEFRSTVSKVILSQKDSQKTKALQTFLPTLERAYQDCTSSYMTVLQSKLAEAVERDDAGTTEKLCELLITDLVEQSPNLEWLDTGLNEIFGPNGSTADFESRLRNLRNFVSGPQRVFNVHFLLTVTGSRTKSLQGIFRRIRLRPRLNIEPRKQAFTESLFATENSERAVATVRVQATNTEQALALAKEILEDELDIAATAAPYYRLRPYLNMALVEDGNQRVEVPTTPVEVGFRHSSIDRFSDLYRKIDGLLRSMDSQNPRDADRLRSAMRYLRLGMSAEASAEVRFLNLWIGLEYLVSKGGYENNIWALREVFPKAHGVDYLLSHAENLYEDLRRSHVKVPRYRELDRGRTILEILQDPQRLEELRISATERNPHLLVRINTLANWANHSKKAADLWAQHVRRVRHHLQRMYRVRNRIVHSGARNTKNLVLLGGNLFEYLEKAILLVVHNLNDQSLWSIDHAFRYYSMAQEYLYDLLLREKEKPIPTPQICNPFNLLTR